MRTMTWGLSKRAANYDPLRSQRFRCDARKYTLPGASRLQNVAKYAGATQATVELRSDPSVLRFAVRDDGRGFDPSAASGSGLQGVRDWLDAIGGSLEIQSSPGAGTTIAGSVPLVVDLPQHQAPTTTVDYVIPV